MNTPAHRIPLAVLAALSLAAPAHLRAQDAPVTLAVARAETDSTMQQPTTFAFTVGDTPYAVSASGAGTRGRDSTAAKFTLPIPADAKIQRLYVAPAGGDLLMLYETDADGGTTTLARLDGASLQPRWTQKVPTMNTAPPVVVGNEMYVAGLDFLGRFNPETGDVAWQKQMLTQQGVRPFQAFGSVAIDGDRVAFTEDSRGRPGRVIHARRSDGTILDVAPPR
jgi:outer membrane protein assembly factor BamB